MLFCLVPGYDHLESQLALFLVIPELLVVRQMMLFTHRGIRPYIILVRIRPGMSECPVFCLFLAALYAANVFSSFPPARVGSFGGRYLVCYSGRA